MSKTFTITNSAQRAEHNLSGADAGSMLIWWKAYATFVADECSEEQQHKLTDYFNQAMADSGIALPDELLIMIAQRANNGFTVLNDWLNENFEGAFSNFN